MATMKQLMEFAKKIKDVQLRKKVVEIIEHPALANKNIKIKPVKYEDAPGSIGWHHVQTGGLVDHTYSVVKNCIDVAFDYYPMAVFGDNTVPRIDIHVHK